MQVLVNLKLHCVKTTATLYIILFRSPTNILIHIYRARRTTSPQQNSEIVLHRFGGRWNWLCCAQSLTIISTIGKCCSARWSRYDTPNIHPPKTICAMRTKPYRVGGLFGISHSHITAQPPNQPTHTFVYDCAEEWFGLQVIIQHRAARALPIFLRMMTVVNFEVKNMLYFSSAQRRLLLRIFFPETASNIRSTIECLIGQIWPRLYGKVWTNFNVADDDDYDGKW